jgi:RNA polymerase sigma factor (sigma-70 family)
MTRADGNTVFGQFRRTLLAGAPDEELLALFVAQRDEAAFAALVRRHGPTVWAVCRRLLTHRQDAEDAFQATFLILACKAASIERRALLANWLFGVARRSALNVRAVRARRARQERLCDEVPDVRTTAETSGDDIRTVLDEELARMPEKYRLPLLLCALEGMTHAEAGKSLGWPTGTVAGRLSRGREMLRSRLLRRGVKASAAALAAVLARAATAAPPAAAMRAAAAVTAGRAIGVGVPPAVAALVHTVLRALAFPRLMAAAVLLAALAVALGGAGVMWHRTGSAPPPASALGGPGSQRLPLASADQPDAPGHANAAVPGKPTHRLPADPNAVVFRMERSVDSVLGSRSVLTVFADGRVVAEIPNGSSSLGAGDLTTQARGRSAAAGPGQPAEPQKNKVLRGRLSVRQLEELLRFALDEQEFFDFDPDAVKAALRDKYQFDGDVLDGTDATTTEFRVRTAERSHEVRWPRLAKTAWDFPGVERLLQLYALDVRLQQVFYVLLAGGQQRVEAVAEKMNELAGPCYRLYPDAPRLTAADLLDVTPFADGSGMRFTFSRNRDKTVRNPLFEVSINVPQRGEPRLFYVIPPQTPVRRSGASGPSPSCGHS